MSFNLDGYVDVSERIGIFREKHPEGSLQPWNPDRPYTIETVDGNTYIVCVEAAYRTPDDPRPGIGVAWEPFPGATQFTKQSELMNAQTGAWGRAIVAVLAADTTRGIATQQDVRNRRPEKSPAPPAERAPAPAQSEADEARAELLAWASGQDPVVDAHDLNARHIAAHGRGLGDEEDVALIRAYMTEARAA